MEQSIFAALAAHGLPGLIIFALGAWIVVLHRELREERRARIDDVKGYTDTLIGMQKQVLTAVDKTTSVQADLKEAAREAARERERGRGRL